MLPERDVFVELTAAIPVTRRQRRLAARLPESRRVPPRRQHAGPLRRGAAALRARWIWQLARENGEI